MHCTDSAHCRVGCMGLAGSQWPWTRTPGQPAPRRSAPAKPATESLSNPGCDRRHELVSPGPAVCARRELEMRPTHSLSSALDTDQTS